MMKLSLNSPTTKELECMLAHGDQFSIFQREYTKSIGGYYAYQGRPNAAIKTPMVLSPGTYRLWV